MDINGPMRTGVLQTDAALGWELHFEFRHEFQAFAELLNSRL